MHSFPLTWFSPNPKRSSNESSGLDDEDDVEDLDEDEDEEEDKEEDEDDEDDDGAVVDLTNVEAFTVFTGSSSDSPVLLRRLLDADPDPDPDPFSFSAWSRNAIFEFELLLRIPVRALQDTVGCKCWLALGLR